MSDIEGAIYNLSRLVEVADNRDKNLEVLVPVGDHALRGTVTEHEAAEIARVEDPRVRVNAETEITIQFFVV
jgi:coenzyme F420-reducing hydrogenase gamma subunit